MAGQSRGPRSLGGKIATVSAGAALVAVFLALKFAPDAARKIGLGFLLAPDEVVQSGEFFDCRITRDRKLEKPDAFAGEFACTARTRLKLSELRVETGLEKEVRLPDQPAVKRYEQRSVIRLTNDWTEMEAGETRTWKIEMKKPSDFKDGIPYLALACEFRYPGEFKDQARGNMSRYLELLEEDQKNHPDKYQLRIKMEL